MVVVAIKYRSTVYVVYSTDFTLVHMIGSPNTALLLQ